MHKLSIGPITEPDPATRWRSIYVAGAVSFVVSVQFSICMSSMLHYLQSIDLSATEEFYGYVVASYSLGQMISSPVFGYLGSRTRHTKSLINVGMAIMILGNLLYVVPLFGRYSLLLSRFLVGFGVGNTTLLRSYASLASTPTDRATSIAIVAGGQTLGQTGGAVFQLLFSSFSASSTTLFGVLSFTGVAYFAIVLNVMGATLLHFCFQNHGNSVADKEEPTKTGSGLQTSPVHDYDRTTIVVCHMARFVQMFAYSSLQILTIPMSTAVFALSKEHAASRNSMVNGVAGVLTLVSYIGYSVLKIDKRVSNRKCCVIALIAFIVFHAITYSYPFLPSQMVVKRSGNATPSQNTSIGLMTNASQATDDKPSVVGCDFDSYGWCKSLTSTSELLYYIGYVITMGVVFPFMNIALMTLLSNLLDSQHQSTQQGINMTFGCAGRLVGPILITSLFHSGGPRRAWAAQILILAATLVPWLAFYRRMAPARSKEDEIPKAAPTPTLYKKFSGICECIRY